MMMMMNERSNDERYNEVAAYFITCYAGVGLIGTLFESNKEPAFAAHKMCQALSGFALFVTAPYLCTDIKIVVVVTVLLLALSGYVALEVLLKMRSPKDRAAIDELVVSTDNAADRSDNKSVT